MDAYSTTPCYVASWGTTSVGEVPPLSDTLLLVGVTTPPLPYTFSLFSTRYYMLHPDASDRMLPVPFPSLPMYPYHAVTSTALQLYKIRQCTWCLSLPFADL